MRILYINAGNLYGGVEVLLASLAKHRTLCPSMVPEFALCFAGRSSEELSALGVPVHLLGEVKTRRPLSILRARRRLERILGQEKYDAVVCHAAWAQAIFGPSVRTVGSPLVFWLHDPPEARALHWLEHWARQSPPDLTLCNSRYTAERIGLLFPTSAWSLIYCPVTPPKGSITPGERSKVRKEFAARESEIVFLQVGRWERHKGHLVHLKALARFADRRDWQCWQVGAPQRPRESEYRTEVQALAAHLGIADRVHFLGWQADLSLIRGSADIYCQPNIGPEPFGITLIEALYSGVPVVSTPMGGPSEILTEDCGILVPPSDPTALAEALSVLMDEPSRRARLGVGGFSRAIELCEPATALGRLAEALGQIAHPGS